MTLNGAAIAAKKSKYSHGFKALNPWLLLNGRMKGFSP
jgi:hypothetical protein